MGRWIKVILGIAIVLTSSFSYKEHKVQAALNKGGTFTEAGSIYSYDENSAVKKIEISKETTYRYDLEDKVVFKDISNTKIKLDSSFFVHYQSGNLVSPKDSVFIPIQSLEKDSGFVEAYYIKGGEVISKANTGYYIDNNGTTVDFDSFIWKLDESRYMVVGDGLKLNVSGDEIVVDGFVELSYVDEGVIQIQTQDNIWKTISDEAVLSLPNNKVVYLADKFIAQEDQVLLTLNKMVVSAEDNIEIIPSSKYKKQLTVPKITIKSEDGENGVEGEIGEQGISGDQGSGGTTGGTGSGGAGGSGSENTIKVYPNLYLSNWTVGALGLKATLYMEDEQAMLSEDANAIIQITKASSEEVVMEINTHNFATQPEYKIDTGDTLQPDTQYVLKVRAKYAPLDDGKIYEKDFLYKKFYTDSSGLYTSDSFSGVNSVSFDIVHKGFSGVKLATAYLFDDYIKAQNFSMDNVDEETYINSISTAFTPYVESRKTVNFESNNAFVPLQNNQEYYVRFLTEIVDSSNTTARKMTREIVAFKTLKKPASIGNPVVTQNKIAYAFEFKPERISDPDRGIEEFVYEVYNADQYHIATTDEGRKKALVTTIRSKTEDKVSLPIDGTIIRNNVYYIVKLSATFNDNAKSVLLSANALSAEFAMAGVAMPVINFVMNPDDAYDASQRVSAYHESIKGNIQIQTQNATIRIDDQGHPLTLTVEAAGDYLLEMNYTPDQLMTSDGQINISVALEGLKKASQYKLTVSGYVDLHDGKFDQNKPKKTIIGSVVISTAPTEKVKGVWKQSSDTGTAIGVNFSIEDLTQSALYEMNSSSRVVFNLYEGSEATKRLIGTYALSDTNMNYHESSFVEGDNKIYNINNDPDFKGVFLNEKSFGQTSGSLTGYTYTIEVEKLYDYTYDLTNRVENQSGYINEIELENNSFVITKRNAPPELPKPGEGVRVYPILNVDADSEGGKKDSHLEDSTVVGYRLESTYDNAAKLGRTMTFYGFENTLFTKGFKPDEYDAVYENDEIYQQTGSKHRDPVTAQAYLFKTDKIKFLANGFGSAPQAVIFFGQAPTGQASAGQNKNGVNYYYTGDYDAKNKTGMNRGMQLKFVYTAELSLSAVETPDSIYPYVKSDYNLHNYHMPASQLIDLPKADPIVYAYPWNMNAEDIVWKYFIYDHDSALKKTQQVASSPITNYVFLNNSYYLQNSSTTTLLPGFLTSSGISQDTMTCKDETGNQIQSCLYVTSKGNYAGVGTAVEDSQYNYLTMPSNLMSDTKINIISTPVSWYNDKIYSSSSQIDVTASKKAVVNQNTLLNELLSDVSLFNVSYDKDAVKGESSKNKVLIDADLSRLDENLIILNIQGNVDYLKKNAGFQIRFEDSNDKNNYVALNKALDNISYSEQLGKISGSISINTSEVASLVNKSINLKVNLFQDSGRYGLGYLNSLVAIRNFSSTVNPGEFIAYNELLGKYTNLNKQSDLPASKSLFQVVDVTEGKTDVSLAVKDLIYQRDSVFGISNHANLYANYNREEVANTFTGVAILNMAPYIDSSDNTVIHNFSLSSITPTIKVDPKTGIKVSLSDITLSVDEIAGAKGNVKNDAIYFLVEEITQGVAKQVKNPNTTGASADNILVDGYWKLDISVSDRNLTLQMEGLEIGKNFQIKPFVFSTDETKLVQLINGLNVVFQEKAVYYVKTSSEVRFTNLKSMFINSSYMDKRLAIEYSLDQVLGFNIVYYIYDTNELGEKVNLIREEKHVDKLNLLSNRREFVYGASSGAVPLEAGKSYIIELIAFSNDVVEGSDARIVGQISNTITSTKYELPIVYVSSLPKFEDSKHSLTLKITANDYGRFLKFDENVNGDYYVEVIDHITDEIVFPRISDTKFHTSLLPNTLSIEDLKPDGTYKVRVYGVGDVRGIGVDENDLPLGNLSEIVKNAESDPSALEPYLLYETTAKTVDKDGIDYGISRIEIRAGIFQLMFTGAVGIDNIASIEGSLSYTLGNSVVSEKKEFTPTVEVLDASIGAYIVKLPFNNASVEGNYNVTLRLYDADHKLIKTMSEAVYYRP